MRSDARFKKRLYTSAVALSLTVGSVGVAIAATGGATGTTAPSSETVDVQQPLYTGSVQAPAHDESLSEADEAARLASLATISADDAAAAASAAVPGTVQEVELDNENGAVVYSVEITDDAGGETDVKVDAGDGSVLDQRSDDNDEAEDKAAEADEADEGGQDENESHVGGDSDD